MDPNFIIGMIVTYFMIGIFVLYLFKEAADVWVFIFWPIVVLFFVLFGLFMIPILLANKIRKYIERKERKQ